MLGWVRVAGMKPQGITPGGSLRDELAQSPLCSNGKSGQAKALREQDRHSSDGETWNISLIYISFYQPLIYVQNECQPLYFTVWSGEEKLRRMAIGNPQGRGIYFSLSQEFETF